ncbi:unnamed protein product [Rotaria socialis]|uniref:Uncharacterized protein n=1 Tax=Rotaria socialis TaxID=392032 RepID=A0A818KM20_9BILA|nr:unnamed protein product [Rotaria socialis]CAF3562771.1 unnamed protein product [Rotaria socialis]CAF4242034.1 unnamed protein product [Rotaria socialis]CAF4525117.1 unnamed protein product [Rotaria socialis]
MIDQLSKTNNSNDLFGEQTPKKMPQETMPFTNELFQRVITGVLCSLNPTTTNNEKQNALNFLEDLKENHPLICLTIGFELLKQQTNNDSLLRHYGIHLIESIVKHKWSLLKQDERYLVKEQLFILIKSSCLNQTFMDPIYIRNALAKCLVEIIKRDCFEKVNTALDEVVLMTQSITRIEDNNSTQLELILLVYRFLNEEVTIYAQSIQIHRRRQLLNQLQKRLNDILPCLIRISNDLLVVNDQRERLTQTCLLAVNSFLIWAEYNHFEQYELFLCELFLKFFQLNSVKLRHASFECLLSLVNKRLAKKQLQQQQQQRNKRIALSPSAALNCQQEKLFLDYLLGDNTLGMFYRLLISPTDSIEQLRTVVTNDHLNCLKMLGQLLVKLANYLLQLFQQLAIKSIDDDQFLTFVNERTRSFLQFLLLLNQHPFHLLSLNSYQALNAFIMRQPTLLSNEQFCLKLVQNLKESLHRVHFPSSSTITLLDSGNEILKKQYEHNQKCFIYALYEYDSEEQFYWKFFSQYRTELQKLIKSFISMFFPDTIAECSVVTETNMSCLKSILQSLLAFLESIVQRTPNKTDNQIQTSLSSVYLIIEWEAFYLLIDHVLFIVRKELFSSSTSIIKSQQRIEPLLMTSTMTEQFLRTLRFLLQFTPNLSEHIHGHVLNLLSVMFFITKHDPSLSIQIIQRLLTTFQLYQQQSIVGSSIHECEVMQTQAANAFLYLCKNFTVKMIDYYSELFPFICQLYKDEFQLTKTSLSITIDESSCPALKLLDAAQTLLYYKLIHSNDQTQFEAFYELIKPIYETFLTSLNVDSLVPFIQYLDLCSNGTVDMNVVRYRRRNLMLALHCLCLLIRYSKQQQQQQQQQQQLNPLMRSKIAVCLRPFLFDHILKVTQYCNQLYDRQINPFYDMLKNNLTYSDTEKQLYLGTYESNNMAKATITSTTTPSSLPVSFVRFQTISGVGIVDDQRLRDYLHRLFDICYQINGMYFAHDADLYYLKLTDDNYFITTFLQKVLFQNLKTLPSFRLRIVLRHFCRSFVEHYCPLITLDKEIINELFLTFLDIFLPYIQQSLTTMWNSLLTTTINYQDGECSDEVIEECVCVLLTHDFVDIIRYFIYKTATTTGGQTNSTSSGTNKKKNKTMNGHAHSESMGEETNGTSGDTDQIDEWDEQTTSYGINNKLLNGTQEKMDYSDLFNFMIKMSRQNSTLALRLLSYVIKTLFECLTFPDAYCVNRFLPIILPLTKLYTDIIDKHVNSSSFIDIKFLFQCLLRGLERHNENEGVNTNLISLIGHIYELWHNQYQTELDIVLYQTIPQLNVELLNTYKTRLLSNINNNNEQQRKSQQITERERRDTIKNLLNPLLLSPMSSNKNEGLNLKIPFNQTTVLTTI